MNTAHREYWTYIFTIEVVAVIFLALFGCATPRDTCPWKKIVHVGNCDRRGCKVTYDDGSTGRQFFPTEGATVRVCPETIPDFPPPQPTPEN